MTTKSALTEGYSAFFKKCSDFAFSPYLWTIDSLMKNCKDNKYISRESQTAAVCAFFTFVIPILPALTEITFKLSLLASVLALVSMIVAYPIAVATDNLPTASIPSFG